jgi:hypothetical protein
MVAAGFVIVCAVCTFAAPTQFRYDGVAMPQGLSQSALVTWSQDHATEVACSFNYDGPINFPMNCGGPTAGGEGSITITKNPGGQPVALSPAQTKADLKALATSMAHQNYSAYRDTFLKPPGKLMVQSFLWIELEAIIGFCVGLGLASLMGSRTVPVVLMIILEIVLTPLLATVRITSGDRHRDRPRRTQRTPSRVRRRRSWRKWSGAHP